MIGTPAIIMSLEVRGHLEGFHYCAETKLWTKRFSRANYINANLKTIVKDNLNSVTDFALDNMFATDGQKFGDGGHAAGDPAGKDGIICFDDTNNYWLTMITAVHPVTPDGNYFRQWQGVLTNDFGAGAFVIDQGADAAYRIGVNLDGAETFVYDYAAADEDDPITMAANDIFTVNWKINVG